MLPHHKGGAEPLPNQSPSAPLLIVRIRLARGGRESRPLHPFTVAGVRALDLQVPPCPQSKTSVARR